MSVLVPEKRGIPAIYRANAQDLILFGAIQSLRIREPETPIKQIIRFVMDGMGIDGVTMESVEQAYYRTLQVYIGNNGI